MADMMDYLDKSGCDFGRTVSEEVQTLSKQVDVQGVSFQMSQQRLEERLDALERAYEELSEKIDSLKQRLNWLLGAYTVIGAIIGYAVAHFMK